MSDDNNRYVFFLGGNDAEMLEIKNILIRYKYIFYDKSLDWWNAEASQYKTELENLTDEEIPVLVELKKDVLLPNNSLIIDHHNEKENNKSSLEQVADLLSIELNRWQQLIAANDKEYIPGMENLCATKNEIRQIRQFDRKAQGVTEHDEYLAEKSIIENKEEQNCYTIIKSLTSKFSPIADRMYGTTNNLLIYTDDALTYYGERKKQIVDRFKNLVDDGKAYYGGSKNGFFGLSKGKVTREEIIEIKKQIIEMEHEIIEKLYSHHVFLFPFKWRIWDIDNEKASLYEKFDVNQFANELEQNSVWKRVGFKLDHYDHYNEFNYFYDYVREVLYDLDSTIKSETTEKDLINHFEYKLEKENKYNIKLCGEDKIYSLEIDCILLNVYKTGTAVLSFHLMNNSYSCKDDILKINKFGRRIYVPFFDLEPDSIFTGNKDKTKPEKVLYTTKKNEIPDALWIGKPDLASDDKSLYEDFENYRNKDYFKTGSFALPKFINKLFPQDFFLVCENEGYLDAEKKEKNPKFKILLMPVLDDRMHVVCWYGNTDIVNKVSQIKQCNDFDLGNNYINDNRETKAHYSYETADWWYSYIFVDTTPMHTDRFVKQKLLKEQTYSRWVEWGTLFGVSRFSFVMLTSNFSDLEKNGVTFLVRHLQSMYYKIVELCLLQRATVLSFSDEVTHVSNLLDGSNNKNKIRLEKIDDLYKHYILFVNKIYFREVTAQEQGIEIYDLMQKTMRLPSDVKDLDNEIGELNQFASKEEAHKLTRLATVFLVPTLIASLLGMNVLPEYKDLPKLLLFEGELAWPFWISIILIAAITFISVRYNLIFKVYHFIQYNFFYKIRKYFRKHL